MLRRPKDTSGPDKADGKICVHSLMTYSDFANLSKLIIPSQISKEAFIEAQKRDPHFGDIYRNVQNTHNFKVLDDLLFRVTGTKTRLVLPSSLIPSLVNTKHYSIMGIHSSKTRMTRDILAQYFVHRAHLQAQIKLICDTCVQCQMNRTKQDPHKFRTTNFVTAPRATWAIDIIPSMSETRNGNTSIFLAVDMFTG